VDLILLKTVVIGSALNGQNVAASQSLADPGFSFVGPRSSAEGASYRGTAGAEGVWFGEGEGSGEGMPPPGNFLGFYASEWCILRAF